MISEYQRVCNVCGKKWHSLVSREAEIIQRKQANAAQGLAGCCSPNTSATSIGTGQLIDSELQRLRQCPECQSVNFEESVVTFGESSDPSDGSTVKTTSSDDKKADGKSPAGVLVNSSENKSGLGCWSLLAIVVGAIIAFALIASVVSSFTSAADRDDTQLNVVSEPSVSVPMECLSAVATAAAVPGEQSNNREIEFAADACLSVEEFVEALKQFPLAAGQTSFIDSDKSIFVPIVCYQYPNTKVCRDAASLGLLD